MTQPEVDRAQRLQQLRSDLDYLVRKVAKGAAKLFFQNLAVYAVLNMASLKLFDFHLLTGPVDNPGAVLPVWVLELHLETISKYLPCPPLPVWERIEVRVTDTIPLILTFSRGGRRDF